MVDMAGAQSSDVGMQGPPADAGVQGPPADAGVRGLPAITIEGRQLFVDGVPLHLKGVNWNPIPSGGLNPQDVDMPGFVEGDGDLMAAASINVVRTYQPVTDRFTLDALWARGIYVMNTVYIWGGAEADSVVGLVNATKDHPAILMWVVGNEWNYNGLYAGLSFQDAEARIAEVARLIKASDPTRPVATVYGEVPDSQLVDRLRDIDIWGLNVYRGMTFGDLFDTWATRSTKPMFLGEFGADAYNTNASREDQAAQADATRALSAEIFANSSMRGGVCAGGAIFEFADEWWKDGTGRPDEHDVGGLAPGGGPHPDQVFNEEWWGLVEIDRTPREAYRAYADAETPIVQ